MRAVADGLDKSLDEGRRAVALIVGRNPRVLDEAGVARAAIESLAENFSDGVVAPILWIALGGLTGGALYKAVNTADSMIGHKNDRYAAFGWASARLDDLGQPARLAARRALDRARRRADARAPRRARPSAPLWRDAAETSLAQRRLAGSRDGRGAGPETRGAARLRRDAGRGRLHGARPERGERRRHPAGA